MISEIIPEDLPEDTKGRLPAIMAAVSQGKNNEQIAAELGVSRYVVAHDRLLWRRSDGYEVWVYEEFQRLHAAVAEDHPITAYRVMGGLLGRLIGQKIRAEIKAKGKIKFDIEAGESIESLAREYEDLITGITEKVFERALSEDGAGEQVDSAQAPSETG